MIHLQYWQLLRHAILSQLQDALDEIARQRPRDLFKPLRVHFIGEAGIDAGGLKKEFFQLLLAELLCPDYGMLIFQPVCFLSGLPIGLIWAIVWTAKLEAESRPAVPGGAAVARLSQQRARLSDGDA